MQQRRGGRRRDLGGNDEGGANAAVGRGEAPRVSGAEVFLLDQEKETRSTVLGFVVGGEIISLIGCVFFSFLAYLEEKGNPNEFFAHHFFQTVTGPRSIVTIELLTAIGFVCGGISLVLRPGPFQVLSGIASFISFTFWLTLLWRVSLFSWRVLLLSLASMGYTVLIVCIRHIIDECWDDFACLQLALRPDEKKKE